MCQVTHAVLQKATEVTVLLHTVNGDANHKTEVEPATTRCAICRCHGRITSDLTLTLGISLHG